jgi:phenylacetate-coenzyme A ligase PaaK-like adenylate-forming protein
METETLQSRIFNIETEEQFNQTALEVFRFQYARNTVYRKFCDALHLDEHTISHYSEIPFLPVELFKTHKIICFTEDPELVFTSSGTTGMQNSRHFIKDTGIYEQSFLQTFEMFYGKPDDYHILALLPGYLEREGSSLIYMVNELIKRSKSNHSGFYLNEHDRLSEKIDTLKTDHRKVLLLGVSFALLDLAGSCNIEHHRLMVMETGGMKGRKKELIREELHDILKNAFNVKNIHSEYGMTELLSQAYSTGDGVFSTPPWMKIIIRDMNDPFAMQPDGRTGGISVIDLANLFSCAFIATQDLGQQVSSNQFHVLGRFDNSDIRGCNLLVSD